LITLLLLQHTIIATTSKIRKLPKQVLIGYTSGHNYTKVKQSIVNDGVNIVIWSFIDIATTPTTPNNTDTSTNNTLGRVRTNLDLQSIASFIHQLDIDGYSNIIHLTSFGGWNGPHLDTTLSPDEWFSIWQNSNASKIFHGIDFDLEGNDNLTSIHNVFTIDCLDLMGSIITLMNDNGYIVSIAPPQSYLNINSTNFSRYVNISIPNRRWHSDFHYFGSNVYAYLLAKYGMYIDLISIQLYESWSDAGMAIYHDGMKGSDYLYNFVHDLAVNNESYHVEFDQDTTLGMKAQNVSVPLSKLVIGLANGWAINNNPDSSSYHKALYISGKECEVAYKRLLNDQHVPRGFMYWTIEERGKNDVYLAKDIGQFLFHSDNNDTSKSDDNNNKKKKSHNNNASRSRGSHHYILGTVVIIGLSIYCYIRRYDIRSLWIRVIDHYHDYVSSLEESRGQQQTPLLDDSSFLFETVR